MMRGTATYPSNPKGTQSSLEGQYRGAKHENIQTIVYAVLNTVDTPGGRDMWLRRTTKEQRRAIFLDMIDEIPVHTLGMLLGRQANSIDYAGIVHNKDGQMANLDNRTHLDAE
jgi:hypothetical protein